MKVIIFALFLILLISFLPVIFFNKTFFFADNFMLMIPGKIFAAQSLKQGILPLWNPYIFSGVPFLIDISQSFFYPSTLFFLIFQPSTALTLTILFHLFIGATGMGMFSFVLWKNRYYAGLASISWGLSPILLSAINNLAVTQTLTWIPWILYFTMRICEKKYAVLHNIFLALCLTLAFIGGHPYPLLFGGIFAGLIALVQPLSLLEKMKRFSLVFLLWISLSAVVLFPFLELIQSSTRMRMSERETTQGMLRPAHALTLLIPNIFSDLSGGISWGPDWNASKGSTGFITIIGFFALIIFGFQWKILSHNQRLIWSVGICGLLYTFGVFLPVVSTLYKVLPALKFLRSPGEAGILWVISGALLLGPALDNVADFFKKHYKKSLTIIFMLFVSLCLVWIVERMQFHEIWVKMDILLDSKLSLSAFHTEERDQVLLEHLMRQIAISGVCTAFLLWAIVMKYRKAVVLVLVVSLGVVSIPSLFLAPSSIYNTQSSQVEFLKLQDMQQFRFLSLSGHLPWTGLPTYWDNMTLRPPFADSRFTHEESQTYAQLEARKQNLAMDWGMPHFLQTPMGYGAFVLNNSADYWNTDDDGASVNSLDIVSLDDTRLKDQSVKYLLVDRSIMDLDSILHKYPSLRIQSSSNLFAVLENSEVLPIVRTDDGEVNNVYIRGNEISFQTQLSSDGRVFIAESWYPGWQCEYEGGACVIEKSSGGMFVILPKGEWNVRIIFMFQNFHIYSFISGGTLIYVFVWSILLLIAKKKRKSKI